MTNKQIDENRSKHGMADGETNREMVGREYLRDMEHSEIYKDIETKRVKNRWITTEKYIRSQE